MLPRFIYIYEVPGFNGVSGATRPSESCGVRSWKRLTQAVFGYEPSARPESQLN